MALKNKVIENRMADLDQIIMVLQIFRYLMSGYNYCTCCF